MLTIGDFNSFWVFWDTLYSSPVHKRFMHKQLTKRAIELNFQLENLRKTKEYGLMII